MTVIDCWAEKMIRRIWAGLIVAAALTVLWAQVAPANPSSGEMAAAGILRGFPDGRYHMAWHCTRAQFIVLLSRALGVRPTGAVNGAWYAGRFDQALRDGWVRGMGNGRLAPGEGVTGEEAAVIVVQALRVQRDGSPGLAPGDPWARAGVRSAASFGLLDVAFFPHSVLSRRAALRIVERARRLQRLLASGLSAATPAGSAERFDPAVRPLLFFAWWCPHCQRALPYVRRLPAAVRPVLVDIFPRSPDEKAAIEAELHRTGLGGAVYELAPKPPFFIRRVPDVLYEEGGYLHLAVGEDEVEAWTAVQPSR